MIKKRRKKREGEKGGEKKEKGRKEGRKEGKKERRKENTGLRRSRYLCDRLVLKSDDEADERCMLFSGCLDMAFSFMYFLDSRVCNSC